MIAFQNFKEATEILESEENKPQIFTIIVSKIINAIDKELNEIILFYYQDENIYHYITYNEYKQSLEKAINYFIAVEEFEMCAEIKNLIDIINKRNGIYLQSEEI
jgi:hypothetical protein